MADSFYESFDSGTGALSHHWGGGLDTSVEGQITLNGGSGGVMEHPSGSGTGHGYGSYTVTAKVEGDAVGPAALLWPADDKWPGTEIDFVEVLPDGTSYGTAHKNDGGDWYDARMYWGNDEGGVHTYGIDWHPDRVDFSVDGHHAGTVWMDTKDAAHGGTNVVFAAMNKNDHTSITVYDMSYSPWG